MGECADVSVRDVQGDCGGRCGQEYGTWFLLTTGGGGGGQGLGIRLFAFGGAYWPLATAHSDPGSERVLVVSMEPLDDLSCLTTPGVGCPGDGLLPVPLTRCIQMHTPSPCGVCRLHH